MKRSGLSLVLAPLIGFLSSCERAAPNVHNKEQKCSDITVCSTLEGILTLEPIKGYDPIKNKEDIGLFNLNSAKFPDVEKLVIQYSRTNCAPCTNGAIIIKSYLDNNGHLYNPKNTGFIIIKGATEYNAGVRSEFPDFEIRTKKNGKWEVIPPDWGKLDKKSPERFLANVEKVVLKKPLPTERVELSDSVENHQVLFGERDKFYVDLARSKGVPCRKAGSEFVCSYNLSDVNQLFAILQNPGGLRIPKSWNDGNDRQREKGKNEDLKYFSPQIIDSLNVEGQRAFREEQLKYQQNQIEYKKGQLSATSKTATSLLDRAARQSEAEFEGKVDEYSIPSEFGNRSKKLISKYLESQGKSPIYERVSDVNDGPYVQIEELGGIVLPANVPKGLIEETLAKEGGKIVFQFHRSSPHFKEELSLMKELHGKKDITFIFVEKGLQFLGVPLVSSGNYFLQTMQNDNPMCLTVNNEGLAKTFYSVESLRDHYIATAHPDNK